MRVIAGKAKGRRLAGPKSEKIRPVRGKVKQAVFNILGDVEGKRVLDLFAGTGSIGIEALSRGAAHCTFVDSSREAILLIRKNVDLCRFEDDSKILKINIPSQIFRLHPPTPFDLIFVDPPYDQDLVNSTLRAVAREKILAPGGTVIVEHSPREPIDESSIASEYKPERIHSGRLGGASVETVPGQMGVRGSLPCGGQGAVSPLTLYDQRKYGQTYVSFLHEKQRDLA